MYRYLSRAPCRRRKDSGSFARGWETVLKNDHPRVRSSQALSLHGRINNSETRYAQLQIINALHLGQRDRAEEMLRGFICLNVSSNANDFDDILEYCARSADPLFVMEAWKVMVKNEVYMKKISYRCVIQAFSKGGYFKEVFGWLTSLEEKDHFHAGLPLCNTILRECVNRQSLIDVDRCLNLMDSRLMGKSEITYWELLKSSLLAFPNHQYFHCHQWSWLISIIFSSIKDCELNSIEHSVLQKSSTAVHDLWKDCIKHYTPSLMMLRKFVWSFTRLHDLESAYKVLQFMVVLVKGKCSSMMKSAAGRYQSSRLDIPIPPVCKLSDEAFRLKENVHFEPVFNLKSIIEEDYLGELDIPGIADSSPIGIADSFLADRDIADACFDPNTIDTVSSGIHQSRFSDDPEKKGYSIPKAGETVPLVNVLRWSFNDVIQYCAQSGTWELAELLFFQMQALGVEPSPHTYDGLVKAVTSGKGLVYGLQLIESMERRSMKPCNDTLAFLSVEHSKNFELNMAAHLLEMISDNLPKYIHPFNTFMVACDIMDEPERAIHMLAKIKHLNIKPNIRTYELLFSLFANVNAPYERGTWPSRMHAAERVRHIERDMMRNGVKHSYASMKNLIRALGAEGMITEMLQRLEAAEKNLLLAMEPHEITDLYNIVLHALVEAKDSLITIEFFKRMRSCGFLADAATYQIMIECCSLITCFRSALALTSLMLREGFFPQIVAYTALVKALLAVDDFEGALDLLNQANSEPIQLDVQLFNEILQHACTRICSKEEDDDCAKLLLDVIELVIEQMHRAKLKPDPSTCTYTFLAYAELGFHSTAVEALRVMSLRMMSEDNDDLLEKRDSFADLVCSEDPDVESTIVAIFKSTEYVAVALLNLRWCTFMTGHPVSWSLGESLWEQRLSLSYFAGKGDASQLS